MKELITNYFGEEEEAELSSLLLKIGVPFRLSGYNYIRHSVLLYNSMMKKHYRVKITKDIYPAVAQVYGTTSKCVERSIRHAIEVVFYSGNLEFINQMFGYTVDPRKGKPTNSEFIAAAAYWISDKNFERFIASAK